MNAINKNLITILVAANSAGLVWSGATVAATLMEEIIVTAQKREEKIQDVPISISAYSGENLQELGVRNLTDMGRFTSGVEMLNSDASQPTYNIRGVQTFDFTAGSDPAVAIYVDGIYTARGAGSEIPLTDIDRVELLKGPQGTLFGRNSIGGAIHIITKKPTANQEGSVRISVGNFDRTDVELAYNQPLTDTLAARFSASSHRRDGWLNNLAGSDQNQEDNKTFRLGLAWNPSDDLSAVWSMSYDERDQYSGVIPTFVDAIYEGALNGRQLDIFEDIGIDGVNGEERDMFSSSLEVAREFGKTTLTSITGWRSFNTDFHQDEDGSSHPDYLFNSLNVTDDDQFSQEFRLNGFTDRLKWTAGLSYSREHIDRTTRAEFAPTTLETFALWEGLKAANEDGTLGDFVGVPLPPNLSLDTVAELAPGVRQGLRAMGLDGIAMSQFLFGLLSTTPLDSTGTLPFDPADPSTSLLGIVPVDLGLCGLAAPGTPGTLADVFSAFLGVFPQETAVTNTIGCGVLPQIQQFLAAGQPWFEQVRNTGTFESTAIYGDLTWALTERMNLSVGARYTYDEKSFTIATAYQNQVLGIPFGIAFFNNGQPFLDSKLSDDWSALSGRVVLDYFFQPDVMGYASISTGFKSGGFNSLNFGPGVETSYDEETVTNYEIGMKGDFLDGNLRLNAATFFYDYKDLQELDLVGTPIPSYNLRNADAEGSGVDVDFIYRVNDQFTVLGNYSYLDTEYTDFTIIEAVGETEADDRTGEARAGTPRNKLNLSLQYTTPLQSLGTLGLRVDYFYNGERLASRGEAASNKLVDSYDLWNARASLTADSGKWEVAVWGRNLEDEEIIADFGNIGDAIGSLAAWPLPPRMYGLDLIYNF